jgi:hypothetical protein
MPENDIKTSYAQQKFKKKQLKEALKKSIQQSKEGKVKNRGSFAKYVKDEI